MDAGPLGKADAWLRFYKGFWSGRLEALERELRSPENTSRKGASDE